MLRLASIALAFITAAGTLSLDACVEDAPPSDVALDPIDDGLGAEDGALVPIDPWARRRCGDERDCRRGQTCEKRGCDAPTGVCINVPSACPDVWQPQCGCDGKTYSNACERRAAQVDLAHRGECVQRCDGIAGLPCPDGQVCHHEAGTCDIADDAGVCVPKPEGCPRVWDPVCGCDGQTYGNRCLALEAGVTVDHAGECEPATCDSNDACKEDHWCARETCDGKGTCQPRPQACPDVWMPVCGCDGKTYSNRCDAAAAGVPVARDGECAVICGGIQGVPCEEGQFCDQPAGTCDVADGQGVCVPQSPVCTAIYDPVCGCDGKTYSSDCVRIGNGVGKDHDGKCECAPVACDLFCQYGFARNDQGCETCSCNPPPECPPLCDLFCPYGNKVDDRGCELCACNPEPTSRCCAASAEPGCQHGASCCGDGHWSCNRIDGSSGCDTKGEVCSLSTTP